MHTGTTTARSQLMNEEHHLLFTFQVLSDYFLLIRSFFIGMKISKIESNSASTMEASQKLNIHDV